MFHLIEYNFKLSILVRRTHSLLFKFYSNSLYSRFIRNVFVLDNNVTVQCFAYFPMLFHDHTQKPKCSSCVVGIMK